MEALLGLLLGAVGGVLVLALLGAAIYFVIDPRGTEPAAARRGSAIRGRTMIGFGLLILLSSSYFWIRLLFPSFWWESLRSPRSMPVEPWQVCAVAAGWAASGIWMIVLGRRVRHRRQEPPRAGS